jgi:hypothetical protein
MPPAIPPAPQARPDAQPHAQPHAQSPAHPHPHAPRDTHSFHPLPVIGHPEPWYEKHIKQAEQSQDPHARASHKVGLHVTRALSPTMPWEEKYRHFHHAVKHHCQAPPGADAAIRAFYGKLADVVRRYAGQEALKVVRRQHEQYLRRVQSGVSRDAIADEAELFFPDFVGHGHDAPDWINAESWHQIRAIEAQWI